MKFAKRLYSELVPEWESKYVDYKGLKVFLKELGSQSSEGRDIIRSNQTPLNSTAQSLLYQCIVTNDGAAMTREEGKFVSHVEEQLNKVSQFYDENEKSVVKKYLMLYEEVRIFLIDDAKKLPNEFPASNAFSTLEADEFRMRAKFVLEESEELLKQKREDYFRAHKSIPKEEVKRRVRASLRKAFLEYYRLLELLKNYKILNYHGFVKIMKKFDKYRSLTSSTNFLQILHDKNFYKSEILDKLMHNIEHLACVALFNGNRHVTMQKLRVSSQYVGQQYPSCFRAGLLGGLSFVMLILVFKQAWDSPLKDFNIHIYAGFLSLLLILWGFGFNSLLWTKFHINYKFIFGFDLRSAIRSYEYLEFVGWISLITSGVFLYSSSHYCPQEPRLQAAIPTLLLACMLVTISLPFKIFRYNTRFWFLKSLGRIFTTPLHKVEYGDFFIADQLTSMTPFFACLVNIGCLFFNSPAVDRSKLHFVRDILLTAFVALPYLIRLLQCVRRYCDDRLWYPHAISGSKYLLNLTSFLVLGFTKSFHFYSLALSILLLSACTLFNGFWDSYYDFGLFRYCTLGPKEQRKLVFREKILYSNRAFHAFVFVTNLLLRLFWIWKLHFVGIGHEVVLLIVVLAEGSRRFLWNLLRLENEQLSNCGLFRAVLEIPLPYESSSTALCRPSSPTTDNASFGGTDESLRLSMNSEVSTSNQLTVHSSGVKSALITSPA